MTPEPAEADSSAAAHEHPQPPLPRFDNGIYGQAGASDPTPIAALLAASAAGCGECYRTQSAALEAAPLLSAHLAALAYQVLKTRAERTGEPVPEVAELAKIYVSTLAAMFAAYSLDAFEYALGFAQSAEPAKRRAMVEQAAALLVEAVAAGEGLA